MIFFLYNAIFSVLYDDDDDDDGRRENIFSDF
jgi:hypothetical protein